MSIVSSNMISKHYCPQCNSFDLLKLHRGFVQKRILGTENKLQCRACGEVFKPGVFDKNIPLEVPVFLETAETVGSVSAIVSEQENVQAVATNSIAQKPDDKPIIHDPAAVSDHLQMSEDDFKVTETILSKVDKVLPAAINSKIKKGPPQHNGNEQLVDETILLKEKKGVWPYVLGSLVVMFGAAYAFIWMPMSLGDAQNDKILVDMSIGEPVQVMPSKQTVLFAENMPEARPVTKSSSAVVLSKAQDLPVNSSEPLGVIGIQVSEAVETEFQLAAINSEEVKVETSVADLELVKAPLIALTKAVVEAPKERSLKPINPRLIPDLGTKADMALGGMSSGRPLKTTIVKSEGDVTPAAAKIIRPVNVPLPEASVRQYDVTKLNQKNPEIPSIVAVDNVNVRSTQVAAKESNVVEKPINQQIKRSSYPVKQDLQSSETIVFDKRAAAILGVSTKDLTALTGVSLATSTGSIKPAAAKTPKDQSSDVNTQLLEKVSVKFIQQDLDKLLPN